MNEKIEIPGAADAAPSEDWTKGYEAGRECERNELHKMYEDEREVELKKWKAEIDEQKKKVLEIQKDLTGNIQILMGRQERMKICIQQLSLLI